MSIGITIGGKRFAGFVSGEIRSSISTLSDSFMLTGANVFKNSGVKAGDDCVLDVAGVPVITGYMGNMMPDTAGNITIDGRDKTGDMIDCTPGGATTFIKQSVLSIIKGLAAPFGIEAVGDEGPTVSQFIVNNDETGESAMLRIVSNYGTVVTSDPDGNLIVSDGSFTNPGAALREGLNIKTAQGMFDTSKRFSAVKAIGQNYANPNLSATETGQAKRTRPFSYYLSGEINQSDCRLSAARIRDYTDASACTVVVVSTALDYYPAGTLVTLEAPSLGVNADMLVESVVLRFEKKTAGVTFTLVPPSKYGGDKIECEYLK